MLCQFVVLQLFTAFGHHAKFMVTKFYQIKDDMQDNEYKIGKREVNLAVKR